MTATPTTPNWIRQGMQIQFYSSKHTRWTVTDRCPHTGDWQLERVGKCSPSQRTRTLTQHRADRFWVSCAAVDNPEGIDMDALQPDAEQPMDSWCTDASCCSPAGYHHHDDPQCPACGGDHCVLPDRRRVACFTCGHEWTPPLLPMPADELARRAASGGLPGLPPGPQPTPPTQAELDAERAEQERASAERMDFLVALVASKVEPILLGLWRGSVAAFEGQGFHKVVGYKVGDQARRSLAPMVVAQVVDRMFHTEAPAYCTKVAELVLAELGNPELKADLPYADAYSYPWPWLR